jgi:uncharacterized surface protein with fasciclin (FAS1) repeats
MSNKLDWNFFSDASGFQWDAKIAGKLAGKASESFKSSTSAKYNARLLGYEGNYSKNATWEITKSAMGYRWVATASNKEEIGKAHTYFATEEEAKENAHLFGYKWAGAKSESVSATKVGAVAATAALGSMAVKPVIDSFGNSEYSSHNSTESIAFEDENTDGGMGWVWWLLGLLLLLGFLFWAVSNNWWQKKSETVSVSSSSSVMVKSSEVMMSSSSSSASSVTPTPVPTPVVAPVEYVPKAGGLVAILAANSNYSTLVTAVKAAGLVEVLDGDGPFTLFAPDNAAFAKLPAGTLDTLLKPENKTTLQALLKNHVISGTFGDSNFVTGVTKQVTTLQGTVLNVSADTNGFGTIQGTKNTVSAPVPSFTATNALVHPITDVILN